MKIEIFQAFVAAAEQSSFSKAGEMLYLSQPTVSRYIGELEKRMGGELFVRNAHTCELTMLGKQVYIHVKRIVNEWQCIEKLTKEKEEEQESAIRIGYAFVEMLKLIAPVLARSGLAFKKTEISTHYAEGSNITRLIREEKLDCAIMHLPSVLGSAGLEIRQICKCSICLYASVNHRLAGYKSLKLEQLIHETEIRSTKEEGYYRKMDEAFSRLNLSLPKHVYAKDESDIVPSIIYKNCVAFSPDIYSPWPDCVKIPIEDWMTDFSLVFVTRKGYYSDATERLYKALCNGMKKE